MYLVGGFGGAARLVIDTLEGPGVPDGPESVGPLAIEILNKGLRPFLNEWHTKFSQFENEQTALQQEKASGPMQIVIDDSKWEEQSAFYEALEENRQQMLRYVEMLGTIAGVRKE